MLIENKKLFFIGQVAARSGIPIKTIRYYEELGLLRLSGRTQGGFRQFSEEVFSRLRFIKQAQLLGLSLQEIGELLELYERGKPPRTEVKQKLKDAIAKIERQIEQLKKLQVDLKMLLSGQMACLN
ncbi:MAG: MerR family DNA-binding protein [Hydrococcus sp. Prado102]|jgi:DNA-binding transcriptional MerR regulator|nr:MerR family DNA-binding protein [Hydrococcus sp. Prado102]